MVRLWGAAFAAILFLAGCSSHVRKPIEVEMPTTQRHFIVLHEVVDR